MTALLHDFDHDHHEADWRVGGAPAAGGQHTGPLLGSAATALLPQEV